MAIQHTRLWLILAAGGVGAVLLFLVFQYLQNKLTWLLSGWKRVQASFPMPDVCAAGELFKHCIGSVGLVRTSRWSGFDIQLGIDGVRVTPGFARHAPILIPWLKLRRIEASTSDILIMIDYERSMWFLLLRRALETVKARIPFAPVANSRQLTNR